MCVHAGALPGYMASEGIARMYSISRQVCSSDAGGKRSHTGSTSVAAAASSRTSR